MLLTVHSYYYLSEEILLGIISTMNIVIVGEIPIYNTTVGWDDGGKIGKVIN